MSKINLSCFAATILFFSVALFVTPLSVYADVPTWRPVNPAELAMKTPKVEPDADAEAIFWEVTLDDKKLSKLTTSHYVRVKIFTERGRERFSKMDIPYSKGKKVEDVAARVIKPDGTIVDLQAKDIFEREIAQRGKVKVMAKSFALPAIEPGVIIEYQYTEITKGDSVGGERLIFQRDIPVQQIKYLVRPFRGTDLRASFYNMEPLNFRDDNNGFKSITLFDVKAFKEEPFMAPEDETRQWAYLRYTNLYSLFQWSFKAEAWNEAMKKLSKPNKEVKAKAAELTAGTTDEMEKLKRIYTFVQKNIKNLSFDRSVSEDELEKIKIKDADDALKLGMGNSMHIELLFASLARAAGFETSLVLASDRSDLYFSPDKYPIPSLINPASIAIKVRNDWHYFNPGVPFMPFGSLFWYEEDTVSMLVGENGFVWKRPPLSTHDKSLEKRNGNFELASDGTLKGTVSYSYSGHQALNRRRNQYRDADTKRQDEFANEIKELISNAVVTNVRIENFDDSDKPLVYKADVTVPNYAQRIGKRIILQPGFFTYGSKAYFQAENRTHGIHFSYPWSEEDKITIKFPSDFELDSADTPADVADTSKIMNLAITMRIDRASNQLTYDRKMYFGNQGNIAFPSKVYPAFKNLFTAAHKADTHAISLKQKAN